jgi:hypothetical protein
MVTLFVRHQVADYETWRKTYDAFEDTRRTFGVKGAAVYREVDKPNDVTATHDFGSLAEAQAFAGSRELKDAMSKAGVVGLPNVWFAAAA